MKTPVSIWLLGLLLLAPFVYAVWLYPQLPDPMPVHFGLNGQPDRYAPKGWGYVLMLPLINVATFALFAFLPKADPKGGSYQKFGRSYTGIRVSVAVLLSIISVVVMNSMQSGSIGGTLGKLIPAGVALFIAALGNYMNNVRQNYFVGFRNAWTLENEEVWRRTHSLGSKLWFGGGLLCAVLALLLPIMFGLLLVVAFVLGSAAYITWFSYKTYKQLAQAG